MLLWNFSGSINYFPFLFFFPFFSYLHAKNIIHRDMKSNSILFYFFVVESQWAKHKDQFFSVCSVINLWHLCRHLPAWRVNSKNWGLWSCDCEVQVDRITTGGAALWIHSLDGWYIVMLLVRRTNQTDISMSGLEPKKPKLFSNTPCDLVWMHLLRTEVLSLAFSVLHN